MNVESKNILGEVPSSSSRKLGLSCAECRRSKLKCDRIFPCQSCVRRGCGGICPEGTLAATKGNKVLMAHAQRLSDQVKTLTARVHELETALAQTQNKDDSTHPLLQTSLVHMSDRDHEVTLGSVSEAIGSLSIGVDGQAKYHGESASSEYFQDLLPLGQEDWSSYNSQHTSLPMEIIELFNAFPFGFKDSPYSKNLFLDFIPPREAALHLANLYYVNIAWMYDPVTRQDFTTSILDPIYGPNGIPSLETLHSHRLSVFFILLANGSVFDDHPSALSAGREYHALARAACSLDSILIEATTATVQALFLIVRYLYNADRDRNEERWIITGLSCRLAQTIGLQRDSANWSLPADDVQRRRRLFWELFTWDAWTGVVNGRPAALAVQHTDCQFPDDLDPSIKPNGEVDLGWHAWKMRYAANILTASAHHVFSPRTPPYSALLELDKKIRKFPIPAHLRSPVRVSEAGRSWSSDPSQAMQQYCALCLRESNLLYIHRSYFAQALRQDPENPLRHKFAPSVLATYRSACRLIHSLRGLYPIHPRLTGFVWYFWSGIFSACIVLGALVVESPKCTLAADALKELEAAIPFYDEGSQTCRAHSTVSILEKLCKRAAAAFNVGAEAQKSTSDVDELQVLGGRKSVITSASTTSSPSHNDPGTPTSLHIDGEEGNSPASQAGAAEMLLEYYEEIGQPVYDLHRRHDYDMDASTPSYSEEASYAAKTTIVSTNPPQPYMRPFISPPGSMMAPEPGLDYPTAPSQPTHANQETHAHAWHTPYSAAHHHSHQAQQQQQSHPTTPMLYSHPLDMQPQQVHAPMNYRYVPADHHEQNQEDIWRNFMMGFQNS